MRKNWSLALLFNQCRNWLKAYLDGSIFAFMAQYVGRQYWRPRWGEFDCEERLRQNQWASMICWLWTFSVMFLVAALPNFLAARGNFLLGLGCLGVSAVFFALSLLCLPEAKRIHENRRIMENEILFGKRPDDS